MKESCSISSNYYQSLIPVRPHTLRNYKLTENRSKPEINFLSPLNTRRLLITIKSLIVERISANVMNEFAAVYVQIENFVFLDDMTIGAGRADYCEQPSDSLDIEPRVDEQDDCDNDSHDHADAVLAKEHDSDVLPNCDSRSIHKKWADNGFIKPLRVLTELSGFTNLTFLYKILVSIAVTSCSAERAMSRIRTVKNKMRSTMLDDWFSSLMVMASEKDLLTAISGDCIIDRFATSSVPLQNQLLYR